MEELLEPLPGSDLAAALALARDPLGVFVSESPKTLRGVRLRPGDRLLGARVSFEGATPEAVGRLLEGAGGCRVSLQLRRSPATPATPGTPDRPLPVPATPKEPPPPPPAPLSVELALPKLPLPKLPPEPPRPPRPLLTVREAAAAARTPLPEPPEPPELSPLMEVAAPKGSLGLSPPQLRLKGGGPAAPQAAAGVEEGSRGGLAALRVPSVPIDAPRASLELQLGTPEPPGLGSDGGSRWAGGLRKLNPPELEVGLAPRPPKFRLPPLRWALAKLREGSATPAPRSPPALAIPALELRVPKVTLGAPFGDPRRDPDPVPLPRTRAPLFFAAPSSKFGGSSPDLRPAGVPKAPPKRGGSAESLIGGRRDPPATPKSRSGWAAEPAGGRGGPEALLELAPAAPGRRFGVKLPKFGSSSSSSSSSSSAARMRRRKAAEGGAPNPRWVPRVGFTPGGSPPAPEPPRTGRVRLPELELGVPSRCRPPGGLRARGAPKFQLPQVGLSPQICGEP